MVKIIDLPKWWTEKPRQLQRYGEIKYKTKNGVEVTRYTKDNKFYNENQWRREKGRALFDAQARAYGRRMGIENYRDAQREFKQTRDNYFKEKERREAELKKDDSTDKDTLSKQEQKELWEQMAYDGAELE